MSPRGSWVSSARSSCARAGRCCPASDAFRFRHLLIRDAAYDALPKAERATLHERFAVWLEEHAPTLVELDEIVGYHLEQAAGYADELGHPSADAAGPGGAQACRSRSAGRGAP